MKYLLPFVLMTLTLAAGEVGFVDHDGVWRTHQNTYWPAATRLHYQTKAEGLTFNVAYADVDDNTGAGFDDPNQGEARRQVMADVLQYLDSQIENTGTLDIEVLTSQNDADGPLATASSLVFASGGFVHGFPFLHITTLVDPCRTDNCGSDRPDMQVTVDFGYEFYTGADAPGPSQFDLFSVLLHEITHGLGLFVLNDETGTSIQGDTHSMFQKELYTANGLKLWSSDGTFAGTPAMLTGSEGGVFYRGERARAALGDYPSVHTPDPYNSGSSLAHWSETTGTDPVMRHQIFNGTVRRTYEAFETGMLADLGYSMTQSTTGAQLFFPWISNSPDFESTLIVTNYGDTPTALTLTARRGDGTSETAQANVTARGFLRVSAENLFPDLGVGPGYSVVLQADTNHVRARWVTNDRASLAPSQGLAVDISSTCERVGNTIVFGYLPGRDGFISAPVLANLSDSRQTVTLYLFDADGVLQSTQILRVDPFVPVVPHFQGDDETGDVYAVAQADSGNLTGVVFVFNTQGQTAIGNVTAVDNFTPPAN